MTNDGDPGKVWAHALVERVGKAVKEARKGKSAAWLSDRTAELGYRISPTVIAKLDSGHRGDVLSVPELIVLAAALNTAPVALLYPNPSDELSNVVQVLPAVETTGFEAVQWFSGLRHGFTDTADGRSSADSRTQFRENIRLLRLWRQVDELRERQSQHSHTAGRAGKLSDAQGELIEQYQMQIDNLLHELGVADDA